MRNTPLPRARKNLTHTLILRTSGQGIALPFDRIGRCQLLVDADPAKFDDPKFPFDRLLLQGRYKCPYERVKVRVRGARREPEDGNPGIVTRHENKRVGEIEVEGDKAATFLAAAFDQVAVLRAGQRLLENRADIMSRRSEDFRAAVAEVLIELELHAAGSSGIST